MIQEFIFKITKGPEGILQTSPERITVGHIDDNESIRLVFERPSEFNNFNLELFLYDWTDNGRVSVGKENVFDLNRPYTTRKFIYLMPSFIDDNGYKRSAGTATLWFDDVIQGGIAPLPPWPDPIAELAKSAWFGKQEIDLQSGEFVVYNLKGEEVTRFSAGGGGGPALWGGISGNIGNQSDLQNALGEKADADDLAAHKADTAKHITETERDSWNQKANENDIKGVADNLAFHQENAVKHITAAERAEWDAKANQTDLAAEESARITADADKADKQPAATKNNFAAFDDTGNIQDSGKSWESVKAYADGLEQAAKNYADELVLGNQLWLPAVKAFADMPDTIPSDKQNYLCRVIDDADKDKIGVWQAISNGTMIPDWTYFSDNADFVSDTELAEALDTARQEFNEAFADKQQLANHKNAKNNPHEVTAEQVGLGNADNTSDINKPVSTPQKELISSLKRSSTISVNVAADGANSRKTARFPDGFRAFISHTASGSGVLGFAWVDENENYINKTYAFRAVRYYSAGSSANSVGKGSSGSSYVIVRDDFGYGTDCNLHEFWVCNYTDGVGYKVVAIPYPSSTSGRSAGYTLSAEWLKPDVTFP